MIVMVIMGTRPEAVKLAPVFLELKKHDRITPVLVASAQHRDMLDQVLSVFHLAPDFDLDVMIDDQTLYHVTAEAVRRLEAVFQAVTPDMVLVQGDTTTSLAGALAGFYEKTRIGHVEAGLRTGDKYAPFPEEINRRLVSVLADDHFAPTETNRQNLIREGVKPDTIIVTGNPVIDALLYTMEEDFASELLDSLAHCRVIMVTAHRRENFGEPIRSICEAIREMAAKDRNLHFLYPVHPHRYIREPVYHILGGMQNVHLLPPLDYRSFVNYLGRSYLVLTDSGGIQEEAPSLNKPVLVLRNQTERPEAVTAGAVKVIGTDRERIVTETLHLLNNPDVYGQMAGAPNPYGDGRASERIVRHILRRE